MNTKVVLLSVALLAVSFTGCGKAATPSPTPTTQANPTTQTPNASPTTKNTPDVVTTASIVDTPAAFEKAISKNSGTWIIAILKDLTLDKNLVLEGEYKNGKKDTAGKDIIQRKIALYAQDANRNITARYTLTAPQLTIVSPMASIQHGTFKGDIYVLVPDFQLVDAKVDGNVYFTTNEAKSTFKMDATSTITGKQEIKSQTGS